MGGAISVSVAPKTTASSAAPIAICSVCILSNCMLHGLAAGQEIFGGDKAGQCLILFAIPPGLPPVGVQLVDHVEDVALLEPDA